jgi:hypothetical protein
VAVVDAADAFDPLSAEAAGVDLARVLWVRAPRLREALRGTERLLDAHGFGLVWLDLANLAEAERSSQRVIWARLERAAAGTNTALLVLGSERRAGAFAEVALELSPVGPRFTGTPPLLEALESDVRLVRRRRGPGGATAVRLRLSAA